MGYRLYPVFSHQATLGEGPLWHAEEGRLYWTDWLRLTVHRGKPGNGEVTTHKLGVHAPSFGFCTSGKLLFARTSDLALWDPATESFGKTFPCPVTPEEEWFNDGKTAPDGSFWFGSISKEARKGRLYRFDPRSRAIEVKENGIAISNGLGWSPDGATFYHTDSGARVIRAFDHNPTTGEIENQRVFYDFTSWRIGNPDGLTVDSEGCVWSAIWDGHCVVRIAPDGTIVETVPVPVVKPTSCTFGGADFTELFVTSALLEHDPEAGAEGIANGQVFSFNPNATGLPPSYIPL